MDRSQPWRLRLPRRGTAGVLELPAGALDESGTALGHRIQFGQAELPLESTGKVQETR